MELLGGHRLARGRRQVEAVPERGAILLPRFLLAEERDLSALLDHLRWLVAHPEGWHEMVEAGRRHIETTYNVVKQSNGLGETYLSAGCDTLRSSRDNVM